MAVYTPLQQKAYEYLKDRVVSGKLDKDQVYSESYFAKELKMSRTPVREALQRLVQEGYIDVLPSRGFVIHPLTESDIVAMYQMRTAIECFASPTMPAIRMNRKQCSCFRFFTKIWLCSANAMQETLRRMISISSTMSSIVC